MPRYALWLLALPVWAQQTQPPATPPKPDTAATAPRRPRMSAAALRNENVAVQQIDNNTVRESNIRIGENVTLITEPSVENGYFAAEHGRPPGETLLLAAPAANGSSWHSDLFESHRSSVFNARTFFQVGPVRPSHSNQYGARVTGSLSKLGAITANASQNKIRGMVNGNVLVPLASERTPLATDPARRSLIERFLAGYPDALPNRTDFDPRALNTNAPQVIDETDGTLRLDPPEIVNGRLSISHTLSRQRVDAFQFVAGQNPDSSIHSHRSRISYRKPLSATTELGLGFIFQRTRSLLTPEPNAVGPRVRIGFQIEELGPDSHCPIDRAQNTFRWGSLLSHKAGRHAITVGGDLSRRQVNGIETNNQRGYFVFSNNFGVGAIENLRLGAPSAYEVTIGELARGYRNWSGDAFVADRFQLHPRVQIYYGLRYGFVTAPTEVNHLDSIPYDCDCNNFSPRVSFAVRLAGQWMARAAYVTSFGEIQPVTFQQGRNNLPLVKSIQVQNPDLLNPLAGIDLNSPNIRTSPVVLASELTSPYEHQYSLSFERRFPGQAMLRFGYVGSRSIKLMNHFVMNRADPVPGIPLTTATVDLRRPDPRFYEVKHIVNGGLAYLDAAQMSIDLPQRRGLAAGFSYTFGKAIDDGTDYNFTAANRELQTSRNQWQYEAFRDKRGLSAFDSTHAVQFHYSYDLPRFTARSPVDWIAAGWQVSGVSMVRSGTPLTLYIGSDAPGFGNVDGSASDRPNILDPSILGSTISHPNAATLILRRDRFAYITPGEPRGSEGRNAFRKAGIVNFNVALTKQWRGGGRHEWTGMIRAEAYNFGNHPQFDEPQRNLSSPAFGKITNTLNDGRVLQIGFRLLM